MEETTKKQNWLVRLWNYYSTYEKIWLFSICSLGILFGIFFPEDGNAPAWLRVIEIIVIVGGCSCELLLSKQSKWAFIVSFALYDTTQTVVYFANGLYISALFEIIYWIPILFISFHFWEKKADPKNKLLTTVKEVNYKRDLMIFLGVLALSVGVGFLFTRIDIVSQGLSEYWYLDALANAFSVCNGLFLLMRFKEQWIPWLGVAIVEAILWILHGQYIMLILSLGYIMNSIYGFVKWTKYIKTNPTTDKETFFGKTIETTTAQTNDDNDTTSTQNNVDDVETTEIGYNELVEQKDEENANSNPQNDAKISEDTSIMQDDSVDAQKPESNESITSVDDLNQSQDNK